MLLRSAKRSTYCNFYRHEVRLIVSMTAMLYLPEFLADKWSCKPENHLQPPRGVHEIESLKVFLVPYSNL